MNLSRRELLTIFLGAPLAAAACARAPKAPRLPDGEILGQSVAVGHRIRDIQSLDVPPDNWNEISVAIIGGGIAGLSAARYLKKLGVDDFLVFELEREPGGTAISGNTDSIGYPWGAHYVPVPFKENCDLIELLDEMSLTDGRNHSGEVVIGEEFLCRDPEERVFYKGRWYEGLYLNVGAEIEDQRQLAEFQKVVDDWIAWRDDSGRRAFVVPTADCSKHEAVRDLDKVSFGEWLRRQGFTSQRLLWYCDYACRDDYGQRLDETSAWAGLFYFCSRAQKSGSQSQPFITFPEGNGRFVRHLSTIVGKNIVTGQAVVAVIPSDGRIEVICLAGETLRGYRCGEVIYSAPVFTAPYVVRGFQDAKPFAAEEFRHNAWFVANLFLRDRPRQRFARDFPLSWDNVIYESPSLGYVNAMHQKGIDYGPVIFTYYYPMCGDNDQRWRLLNYTREELAEVCLADLERAHPDIRSLCDRIDIMRWGHAMISPRPGFIFSGEREKAMQPFRGVRFAHTDLSGVALFEEAFFHGTHAAREAAASLRISKTPTGRV
ncbi:MAG: twin-arginine translocation pathway signal [Blastocatellia bacterium]